MVFGYYAVGVFFFFFLSLVFSGLLPGDDYVVLLFYVLGGC